MDIAETLTWRQIEAFFRVTETARIETLTACPWLRGRGPDGLVREGRGPGGPGPGGK